MPLSDLFGQIGECLLDESAQSPFVRFRTSLLPIIYSGCWACVLLAEWFESTLIEDPWSLFSLLGDAPTIAQCC
jgi:hypothetical protein